MARLPVLQAVGLQPNHHRIDPATGHPADMSPFEFAAGSYHLEFGRDPPISDESERQMQDATFRIGAGFQPPVRSLSVQINKVGSIVGKANG